MHLVVVLLLEYLICEMKTSIHIYCLLSIELYNSTRNFDDVYLLEHLVNRARRSTTHVYGLCLDPDAMLNSTYCNR
jgi:hypothetical protein